MRDEAPVASTSTDHTACRDGAGEATTPLSRPAGTTCRPSSCRSRPASKPLTGDANPTSTTSRVDRVDPFTTTPLPFAPGAEPTAPSTSRSWMNVGRTRYCHEKTNDVSLNRGVVPVWAPSSVTDTARPSPAVSITSGTSQTRLGKLDEGSDTNGADADAAPHPPTRAPRTTMCDVLRPATPELNRTRATRH